MSGKAYRAARKRVEPIAAKTIAEQRAAFRLPLWRRVVGLFFPAVKRRFVENFERNLARAIHVTTKAVTHKVARRTA